MQLHWWTAGQWITESEKERDRERGGEERERGREDRETDRDTKEERDKKERETERERRKHSSFKHIYSCSFFVMLCEVWWLVVWSLMISPVVWRLTFSRVVWSPIIRSAIEATSTRNLDCLNPETFLGSGTFFYRVHTEPCQDKSASTRKRWSRAKWLNPL